MNFTEAKKICKKYKTIIGLPYDEHEGTTPVLDVLVAPAGEGAQVMFMDEYDYGHRTNPVPYASEDGYNVIVVARYAPDLGVNLWTDLDTYLSNHNIVLKKLHLHFLRKILLGGKVMYGKAEGRIREEDEKLLINAQPHLQFYQVVCSIVWPHAVRKTDANKKTGALCVKS